LEREDKFRGGVRILLAGAVVPITWLSAAVSLFASSAPWFSYGPQDTSLRNMMLRVLAGLVILAGGVLILGLLRQARWRWAACGAWTGATVASGALFSSSDLTAGLAVFATGAAIVAVFAWVMLTFDPPAT
jgi:hypothetical protein